MKPLLTRFNIQLYVKELRASNKCLILFIPSSFHWTQIVWNECVTRHCSKRIRNAKKMVKYKNWWIEFSVTIVENVRKNSSIINDYWNTVFLLDSNLYLMRKSPALVSVYTSENCALKQQIVLIEKLTYLGTYTLTPDL